MHRRHFQIALAGLLAGRSLSAKATEFASVRPGHKLVFPADHGAHPQFRTEWWYVTGYAGDGNLEAAYGFQVTFFRSRVAQTQALQKP